MGYLNQHSYTDGYNKAITDLRGILTNCDRSLLTKTRIRDLMFLFVDHIPEMITWGDKIELDLKNNQVISKPTDQKYPWEYKNGYKAALIDVARYMEKSYKVLGCLSRIKMDIILDEIGGENNA